ncbi:AMP-binding protein [Winogradskyella maritima]|uniref:AMP-binding protein n=1 Tax=Winogradskyella maritima TaxID=1517766 RepID=A0ABV8AHQ8_9FLAO|nr:AMP-binding protein [Winogradskyella maritima]
MTPHFTKIHNRFKLNGHHFSFEALKEVAYSLVKEGESFEQDIGQFLMDWLDASSTVSVKTSGSTGVPKTIKIQKQYMVNSAIATGDYFKLEPGDTALHCLPSKFIAGKMMLVRALVLGLELECVQPSSSPVWETEKHYDFSAMVPLQLSNVLSATQNISKLIVGGAKLSDDLKTRILQTHLKCYETYGMTETITHVAVKAVTSKGQNGDIYFKALPNVNFSQDERDCLVVDAPTISKDTIVTNDVVDLKSETSFEWLGRYDNVINSGGLKLFPEQLEELLSKIITEPFMVSSIPDDVLGQKVVLIVESETLDHAILLETIKSSKFLSKQQLPKQIVGLKRLVYTKNGKLQRQKTKQLAIDTLT